MSCFIVSDKLMNDTLNFIYHKLEHDKENIGQCVPFDWFNTVNFIYDNDITRKDLINEICALLSRQNVESWNARYPNDKENYEECKHAYKYHYECISIAQFLKNIDCIAYQSCETKDYENCEAYKVLQYIRDWATRLIDGYKQAKWGY